MEHTADSFFGVPVLLTGLLIAAWFFFVISCSYWYLATRDPNWQYESHARSVMLSLVMLIGATVLVVFQQPERSLRVLDLNSVYQLLPSDVTLLTAVMRATYTMILLFTLIALGAALNVSVALNSSGYRFTYNPRRIELPTATPVVSQEVGKERETMRPTEVEKPSKAEKLEPVKRRE